MGEHSRSMIEVSDEQLDDQRMATPVYTRCGLRPKADELRVRGRPGRVQAPPFRHLPVNEKRALAVSLPQTQTLTIAARLSCSNSLSRFCSDLGY